MNEPSAAERLTALRLLRRVQVADLERTDRWIAQAEQQAAPRPAPTPDPPRAPLPRPDYVTQTRHGRPPLLHGPECWMRDDKPGTPALTPDAARQALLDFTVEACDLCHPEVELKVP